MANNFLPKCSPIWGFPMNFSTADLQPSYQPDATPVLDSVAAPATIPGTSSLAISIGARGISLQLTTEVAGATCNLTLYQVIGGVNTLVKTWTGAVAEVYFAGNLERVDMQGNPFVVTVDTISTGTVTVTAKVMY